QQPAAANAAAWRSRLQDSPIKPSRSPTPLSSHSPKIYIVVPAYNEEEGLPRVLDEIHAILGKEKLEHLFIVVNDGSKDRTRAIAEEYATRLPVEIINHPTNLNVGAVFRNGLTRAAELANP